MKNILVPTDFSKNASNALNYAIALAKKDDAFILLLHSFEIPYIIGDTTFTVNTEQVAAIRDEAENQLKKLCSHILSQKVKCGYLLKEGLVADTILETAVKKRMNLIVMGTQGASGLKRIMIGSNTARVVQNAKCPVIAVPEKAGFKKPRNIVYATAYNNSDVTTIQKLMDLSDIFQAPLQLVHISDVKNDEAKQREALGKFADKVKEKTGVRKIQPKLLYGKNVESRLEEYVQEEQPDLLVMSTHYRTFTEKLFGKSTTRRTAYHTQVPLMVFHRKQKTT